MVVQNGKRVVNLESHFSRKNNIFTCFQLIVAYNIICMKNRLLHITLCLAAFFLLYGCGAGKSLKKAKANFYLGEYNEAAKNYRKAYKKVPSKARKKRADIAYDMGLCYDYINYTMRAKAIYSNAIRYGYNDSIIYLKLARACLESGDYKQAKKNFTIYLNYKPNDVLAKNGLESCALAVEWKKNPTRHKVRLFKLFNSRRADYSPSFAGDDNEFLYLTSSRREAKGENLNNITGMKSVDMFMAKKNEKNQWERPEAIASEINSEDEDGTPSFTPDGQTMYFTRCRKDDKYPAYAEIYSSQRTGANWATPQKCIIIKDSLSSVAHPAVSPDGNYLYFTSDMPGGEGGLDLWRCKILDDSFGAVENLGKEINTAGNEVFPSFRANGNLYFSSDGLPGMGGLDIFRAKKDSLQRWHIHNMKSPINSNADDFGITFEGENNKGFFSSNRKNARGWDHIYSFEVPQINYNLVGWVYEKEGYELPEAIVSMVGTDGTNTKINVKKDGSFTAQLKRKVKYVLMASCRGFLNYKQALIADSVEQDKNYVLQFPLSAIGQPVLIENVFYEFDKAQLTAASTQALDELVKLLKDNPSITIELSSHSDYKGPNAYNLRLSQRRAESVVRYLIRHGIDKKRLTAKGYGETKPKYIRKRVAEKWPFLHEKDILTEEYIKKLTPDQQEICNAINRRTEFTVIRTTYNLFN